MTWVLKAQIENYPEFRLSCILHDLPDMIDTIQVMDMYYDNFIDVDTPGKSFIDLATILEIVKRKKTLKELNGIKCCKNGNSIN
jgi:hypothetical protein